MSATRPPLSTRQSFLPDEIARREFNSAFRGYEPAEVRAFLAQLSEQAAEMADVRAELQLALADAENRVGNPELDEETVTRLLGEQTAQILRSAREAAAEIRQRAEDEVSTSLREAHEASTRMREEASTILADRTEEANTAAQKLREQADHEVAQTRASLAEEERRRNDELDQQIAKRDADHREQMEAELEDARGEARSIIATAREEAEGLVERTRKEQEDNLASVLRKRSIALAQVEELRAGRQRLLDAYKMVRETLDDISGELERVDEEARTSATKAGAKSAQEAGLSSRDLDEPIVLEDFQLNDDVSRSVIDLVDSDDDQEQGSSGISRAQISSGQVDHDDQRNGGQRGGTSGGGAGFFDHASGLDADDEENLWSPVEERLGEGINLPGTRAAQPEAADAADVADPPDQQAASGVGRGGIDVAERVDRQASTQRASTRTGSLIGEADRGNTAQSDRLMLMRREATTTKNRPQAIRRLKNALGDEQDAITAQVQAGSVACVEDLLGSLEDQASHYQHSIMKLFREIVRDGASSVQGSRGIPLGEIEHAGNEAARSLALALVEDLRDQLVPVLEADAFGGVKLPAADLATHIAAPYVAISGPYLDVLVDDRVGAAFDHGVELARN